MGTSGLRRADPAHRPTGTDHPEGGLHGLPVANTLEHGVRAVGLRHPHRLTSLTVHIGRTSQSAVTAGGLQPFAAEVAGVVGPHERRHHHVTRLEPGHGGTRLLDHTEELVPDPVPVVLGGLGAVRPQVAAGEGLPLRVTAEPPDQVAVV